MADVTGSPGEFYPPVNTRAFVWGSAVVGLLAACDPDPDGGGDSSSAEPVTSTSLRISTRNVAFMSLTFNSIVPLPPPLPDSITYNVFAEKFNASYKDRANAVADSILEGDDDVVALNEVFSAEAREILVDRLRERYPYYVARIKAYAPHDPGIFPEWLPLPPLPGPDYLVDPLDSGLMLFSRFEFEKLDNGWNDASCAGVSCDYDGINVDGAALTSDEFAFRTFEACSDLDCFASKGVGLVKIAAPHGETYVAFTHMQADVDYNGQFADDRQTQYEEIAEFLEFVVGSNDLLDKRVMMVGDLNTPGESTEWLQTFSPGNPASFFECANNGPCSEPTFMTDAWGFGTSPNDPGYTQGSSNRLDYVLHNSEDGALCMQHAMIAYDTADDGDYFHSDHRPIRADFNASAPWCSPNISSWDPDRRPRELQFGHESCDLDPATPAPPCHQDEVVTPAQGASITHPGSFQWFRITQPGSYVMATYDADKDIDIAFDVYDSRDLSRPIEPVDDEAPLVGVEGTPGVGEQFLLSQPPYYIRTYAAKEDTPDRTVSSIPYVFHAHQNLCRAPNDACVIEPNIVEGYDWPDQSGATLDVADVWFKFRTSGVKSGVLWPGDSEQFDPPLFPTEEFIQEVGLGSASCVQPPVLEEYSTDGQFTLLETLNWAAIEGGGPFDDLDGDLLLDGLYTAPELPGDTAGKLKFYFAHLSRSCTQPATTFLEQRTSLTYFEPHRIKGLKQYDDSGIGEDDTIRFLFTFDAPNPGSSPPCENACQLEYVFDEPDLPHQSADFVYLDEIPTMRGYYVDEFYPNVFEDENGPDKLLDVENYTRNGVTLQWIIGGMSALRSELPAAHGRILFSDSADIDSADYWYEMEYTQRRRR